MDHQIKIKGGHVVIKAKRTKGYHVHPFMQLQVPLDVQRSLYVQRVTQRYDGESGNNS